MLLIAGYLNLDKDPERAPLGARSFDVYVRGGVVKFSSLYCAWLIGMRSPSKSLTK